MTCAHRHADPLARPRRSPARWSGCASSQCPAYSASDVDQVHADARGGGVPALLQRQVEQHGRGRRARSASCSRQFLFQLPGAPAGVAQRHQRLARPFAARQRFEDVARGGEARPRPTAAWSPIRARRRAARSRGRDAPGPPATTTRCSASLSLVGSSICCSTSPRVYSARRLTTTPIAPSPSCWQTRVTDAGKCGSSRRGRRSANGRRGWGCRAWRQL